MTPDEIRADMASRQKQLDALTATQKERAQELAEALRTDAQKPLADMTIAEVYQEHNAISNRLFGPSGNGASWNACYMQALHELVQRALAEGEARIRKLAPEPAPDPEVEAVAQALCDFDRTSALPPVSLSMRSPIFQRYCRESAVTIIAALDAVRAERRARVQDARVEAALEILRGCFNDSSVSWDGLAKRILAAADAAEKSDA